MICIMFLALEALIFFRKCKVKRNKRSKIHFHAFMVCNVKTEKTAHEKVVNSSRDFIKCLYVSRALNEAIWAHRKRKMRGLKTVARTKCGLKEICFVCKFFAYTL